MQQPSAQKLGPTQVGRGGVVIGDARAFGPKKHPPLLAPSDSAKSPPKFSHENLSGQVDESVSLANLFIKFLWEELPDFAESDGA